MNLVLSRKQFLPEGIFGELRSSLFGGELLMVTLEHSYLNQPKVPSGSYLCVRGFHKLKDESLLVETFEIKNVPDHTGILFHVGNYGTDSHGCVLLGTDHRFSSNGIPMIVQSRLAFNHFLELQKGVSQFELIVE